MIVAERNFATRGGCENMCLKEIYQQFYLKEKSWSVYQLPEFGFTLTFTQSKLG
jgi:hypothetical protein